MEGAGGGGANKDMREKRSLGEGVDQHILIDDMQCRSVACRAESPSAIRHLAEEKRWPGF